MSERWTPPTLPADPERLAAILQPNLNRLERVLGRTPVVTRDRLVAAATTLTDDDDLVLVDTTAGGVTVTLPPANAGLRGREYNVKKMNAGANNITLDGAGGDTIDGAATLVWNTQYACYTVRCVLLTAPATYGWVIV